MYLLLNSFSDIAAALRLIESFLSYRSFLCWAIQKINDFLKNNQGIFPISLVFVFIPTSKDSYFEVNTNEIFVYHNALNQSIRFSLNKCVWSCTALCCLQEYLNSTRMYLKQILFTNESIFYMTLVQNIIIQIY